MLLLVGAVTEETEELHAITFAAAGLLCAGACWAGAVMPPAYGLGKLLERVVVLALMLLLVGPMETEPSVFVVGTIVLRLWSGEGC
jgi:hypothetical protein